MSTFSSLDPDPWSIHDSYCLCTTRVSKSESPGVSRVLRIFRGKAILRKGDRTAGPTSKTTPCREHVALVHAPFFTPPAPQPGSFFHPSYFYPRLRLGEKSYLAASVQTVGLDRARIASLLLHYYG